MKKTQHTQNLPKSSSGDGQSDWYFTTDNGKIFNGDSYHLLSNLKDNSVDLIMTSPPFGLIKEKDYGNVHADDYISWFKPFARQFHRILKKTGSLVIDIGGTWNNGVPTRHLYQFKLLIMLCDEYKFHLAQDFYWWNPAKLPTPAEWVTIRRIRVKDAINKVWWLSKTEWPKASNRRVLQPYTDSMKNLLNNGYTPGVRPSGHDISNRFQTDNGGAIPPNLLALANTESQSSYLRYCKSNNINPHPARFPAELPEFFVRMLTDKGDLVVDPFAGSCVTGEVCERLGREWICSELREDYLKGAKGRFIAPEPAAKDEAPPTSNGRRATRTTPDAADTSSYYKLPRPGLLWDETTTGRLDPSGGKKPPATQKMSRNSTKPVRKRGRPRASRDEDRA